MYVEPPTCAVSTRLGSMQNPVLTQALDEVWKVPCGTDAAFCVTAALDFACDQARLRWIFLIWELLVFCGIILPSSPVCCCSLILASKLVVQCDDDHIVQGKCVVARNIHGSLESTLQRFSPLPWCYSQARLGFFERSTTPRDMSNVSLSFVNIDQP